MAMDTASKRASAIGVTLALRLVLPIADASVDQPDRQHVAYCYAGIFASAPVLTPVEIIHAAASFRTVVEAEVHFRTVAALEIER